uniref:RWP-RK domain-containing protein n=1 Tax=Heterorhabditis bacteriophora TaxID=37862 RepID=A0A1I7X903_HETBA
MADRNWPFLNSEMLSEEFFERKSPSSFKEDPEEVIVDSGSVSTDKISEQLLPFPSSAPKMVVTYSQSRQNNVAHSANTYLEPILLQDEGSGPVPLSANNYAQPQEHQDFSSTDSNNYVTQYPYSYHKSMKFDDPQSLPQQYVQAAPESAPTNQYYSPSYSYPIYNPGLNGIFNRMQCFSGDMEVETPAGFKAIKDLEIGDMVLSIDESMVTFSPIIMFLHKLDDEEAEFNLLEMVLGVGIYAPLTSTGDIFVNRVLSSCHSNLALKTLQQTFFIAYNRFSNILKRFSPKSNSGEENLPYGLPYLTTVIDLFLPKSVL